MIRFRSLWIPFGILIMSACSAFAQLPTDNLYTSVYGTRIGHWTDSLKWSTVYDVTTFGAIPNDNNDDYAAIIAGIDTIASKGGGVLYFPAGRYLSNETINLKSGVLLRGANLISGQDNPLDPTFAPPSAIWFPKYEFDTTANGGAGVPNSTAFKLIEGEKGGKNMGLVNLDINRAVLKFQPYWVTKAGFTHRQPQKELNNIIILGVRSCNAVIPDPVVPNATQRPWQRVPWRFSTNIDVNVGANAVVAKCRLNDGVQKDNFLMEGYLVQQRGTTRMRSLTAAENPTFDYDAHYGISVNRKKTYQDVNGAWKIDGYVSWASPFNEPTLFALGIEILDNYIYKTNRVAVIAAGNGLIIKGNETQDDPTKPNRTDYLGPTGTVTPQGATTFENRGLDFSGWNVKIENNTIVAYRHRAGGYLSTDGEGILLQECCGGTQVNDYVIKNNNMVAGNYIGIYKMRDINNLEISGNNLGNASIQATANTNGADYYLNGTYVANNTNVGGISLNGSLGGVNCLVKGNTGRGTSSMNVACHVLVDTDNTGFAATTFNSNGGQSCAPLANFPQAVLVGQGADSTFCTFTNPTVTIPVLVKVTLRNGDPTTSRAEIIVNNVSVATGLTFDVNDSTARYILNIPAVNGITTVSSTVTNGGNVTYTRVRSYTQNCPVTSLGTALAASSFSIFPNPSNGKVSILNNGQQAKYQVCVSNLLGQLLHSQVLDFDNNASAQTLDLSSLKKGIYFIRMQGQGTQQSQRLVIE